MNDLRIRDATVEDAAAIARVHIDSWRTTYPGIVPQEILDTLSYEERELRWRDILTADETAIFTYVAKGDQGEIVGFAGGGLESNRDDIYRGELHGIYLLIEHQRKGVGRRLVSTVARRLLSDGIDSMLVWVLEDNKPACAFYEVLGGERVGEKSIAIGGADLAEVAYGWGDIRRLATKSFRE